MPAHLPRRAAPNLAILALAFCLPAVLFAQSVAPQPVAGGMASARAARSASRFLLQRMDANRFRGSSPALLRMRGMEQRSLLPHLLSGSESWEPVGPAQIETARFGPITGRVTSITIAPWDSSGNTVYLGTAGGGVWLSRNAAAGDPASVTWQPLTDSLSAYSGVNISSLSIGAVSVQPGTAVNGIVLAGTGDPNGALDSYYGAGILRSTDGGATWRLIRQSSDGFAGGIANYSFAGDAFSGFAWSTTTPNLVVAAVTVSPLSLINNINNVGTRNVAEAGLYYSTDGGQTWYLSTIEDGPNQIIQSSQTTSPQAFPGVAATSVVWNPVRKAFYASIRYHGYYESPDGVTWTRLKTQPGTALTAAHCPFDTQSNSCAIFRGALAVQPQTGDMFALTVDAKNADQGLWQDVCSAGPGGCANPVSFGLQIVDAALDDGTVPGTIPQGTYNLALAAIPDGADTLLFAGTQDIFRCSLAAGCTWRNTTNADSCASARVAPAEHAIVGLASSPGRPAPLLYFGNDGGVWRSTDGVNETGASCDASDASHFQNLNSGLGSLAEVTGLASSPTDANILLAGFGRGGSAAAEGSTSDPWPQLSASAGGQAAIDSTDPENWYISLGLGVDIGRCTRGSGCTAADFSQPAIGPADTAQDESLLSPPFLLDPGDSSNIIVGTCRVWRGPTGGDWTAADAISPMLDGVPEPRCAGNALIRSLAAGGPTVQSATGAENSGSQVIYAGMAGLLDGGGAKVGGDVFSTQTANLSNGTAPWANLALSPVANESAFGGVFNPGRFDVSSIYVDPHDAGGQTVYATVQGFGTPHLYRSTDGGAHWTNITKNLPDLPANDVLVDPDDPGVVYVASDGGVFVTKNVEDCTSSTGQCWSIFGTGLPLAPAMRLSSTPADGGLLRVGTYGRGIWQTPLLSGAPQTTMTLAPSSLTFGSQAVNSKSSAKTITVTNSGKAPLIVRQVGVTGNFLETDDCGAPVQPNSSCQVQVIFAPSIVGTQSGTIQISANAGGSQNVVSLSGAGTSALPIEILPASIDFGEQQTGTASDVKQVTVSNTGSSAVALNSESVTGSFAIKLNTCAGTLAPKSGCTLAIAFQPTQAGPASGMLTVVSGNGTQTVDLSGTGEDAATDTLSASSLTFPFTPISSASAPQTLTLTNSGGVPLSGIVIQTVGDFDTVSNCGTTLAGDSSCSMSVRFTPHASGTESGSIVVTDALRSQTVSLMGTGAAPATDSLSAASLVFPLTLVGENSAPESITITNSGDMSLTGLTVQVHGSAFSQTSTCGSTLAAKSSCAIAVTFHPTAAGNAMGELDISDALRTQAVSLTGQGQTPAQDNLFPLTLSFPSQTVGTTSTAQTATLRNNGQAVLTGIRLQSTNPDFQFTSDCGTSLAAAASCAIHITFSPRKVGLEAGTLVVADDNRSQSIQLSGAGTLANVALAPSKLNFGIGGVQISSPAQTLVFQNGSASPIDGIAVSVTGPFHETDNCGVSLPPETACSISVVFAPSTTGMQHGRLTVSSPSAGSVTAELEGTGISYKLLPMSGTTAAVDNGDTANYTLQLIPATGSSGFAVLNCSDLPPNATCTLAPVSANLSAGPTTIQVSIRTGVKSSAIEADGASLAGFGTGLPWPLAVLLIFALTFLIHCRRKKMPRAFHRIMTVGIVLALAFPLAGCGKGIGPLDPSAENPLPGNGSTPPGTYTMTVEAAAGGMNKAVNLSVQVK
jgi:hypothetical protein